MLSQNKILIPNDLPNSLPADEQGLLQTFDQLAIIEVVERENIQQDLIYIDYLDDQWLLLCKGSKVQVSADFLDSTFKYRLSKKNLANETVVKAVKGRQKAQELSVLDATAGFGRDSFLMAAAGMHVLQIEKIPLIHHLVNKALDIAKSSGFAELENATKKITTVCGNSIEYMAARHNLQKEDRHNIVFLDPMYVDSMQQQQHSGLKESAAVNKHLTMLQAITVMHKTEDEKDTLKREAQLFESAINYAKTKVVVKRPPKAPWLNRQKPSSSLSSKAVRFDIYPIS